MLGVMFWGFQGAILRAACRQLPSCFFLMVRLSDLSPVSVLEYLNASYRMDLPGRTAPCTDASVTTVRIVVEQPAVHTNRRRSTLHRATIAVAVAGKLAQISDRPGGDRFAKPGRYFRDS